jgi:hypothetical protein
MGRYKENRSIESSLPLGGETGKGIGWNRDKADSRAWKDLKGR